MTPEQEKDAERLDRYIAREGLASVMNKTKWREAMQVLQDVMGFNVRFRLKDVRGSEPLPGYWEGSFPYHIPPHKTIEWIEIRTLVGVVKEGPETGRYFTGDVADYSEKLAEALSAKSIPFFKTEGVIRIQGYTRFNQPAS